jgi:hypothetical protein
MANHQQNQQHNKPAFVLGNGKSRLGVDLAAINRHGVIYACNAVYREYTPDHLIAVDAKMVKEIVKTKYHLTNRVWTNPNTTVTGIANINYLSPHKGWSSGPTALWLAVTHGFSEIYILGFDFEGINGNLNNVYADTDNYRKSTDTATYWGNWINQTASVIKSNPTVTFYRVVRDTDNTSFKELPQGSSNFQHMSYENFLTKYPTD